ncbi:glycosyltransferase family 4 protein [Terribacillus sp. AE2B 122]|uniref:glycosyltransferase family 4 protein n=1 Tax=Terribacillus sp. AE2B 122 TaxID=1331902 RepID=UPI00353054FE
MVNLRILLVSYYPMPHVGGLWTVVNNLQNELTRLGHEVDVLAQTESLTEYRILGQEAPFKIADVRPYIEGEIAAAYPNLEPGSWIHTTEVLRYSLELTALATGLDQYDVIHAQDVIAASSIERVKPTHIPLVTSVHGYLTKEIFLALQGIYPNKSAEELYSSFEYQYHEHIEHIGCHVSEFIHTQADITKNSLIEQHRIPENRFVQFPYGMDITSFRSTQPQLDNIPVKTKPIILFVGRLVQLKGVHILIEALYQLKEHTPDWECWMLGDGYEEAIKRFTDLMEDRGLLSDIRLLGSVTNVKDFLETADIFVLPSLQDTQPHSVMEAQLSGIPVVVSNAGGLPEMVQEGVTGLVSEAGNPASFANQLARLLEDANLRKQIASQAQAWANQQWSLVNMGKNTEDLYKKAIPVSN